MEPKENQVTVYPEVLKLGQEYIEVIRRLAKNADDDETKAKILKEGMIAASLALRFPPATHEYMVED